MEATVDLSSPGQSALADEATPRQGNRTGVYSGDEQEIDAMIARIISSNLGKQPAQAANH